MSEKALDATLAEMQKSWPERAWTLVTHNHAGGECAPGCQTIQAGRDGQEELAKVAAAFQPYVVLRAILAAHPGLLTELTAGLHPRTTTPTPYVFQGGLTVNVPQQAAPVVNVEAPAEQRVAIVSMPKPPASETTVLKRDAFGRIEKTTRKAVTA